MKEIGKNLDDIVWDKVCKHLYLDVWFEVKNDVYNNVRNNVRNETAIDLDNGIGADVFIGIRDDINRLSVKK